MGRTARCFATRSVVSLVALATGSIVAVPALAQRPGTGTGAAEDRPNATVEVRGEAETRVAPNVAHVELTVQNEGPNARETMRRNAEAIARVLTAVRRLGVVDRQLHTSGIRLSPLYHQHSSQDGRPPEVTAYRASNSVVVTVDPLSRLGAVVDAAVGAGANTVSGVRFSVREESEIHQRVLAQAVRSARAKADVLARAADARVAGVRQIVEETAGGARPHPEFAPRGGGLPPVEPGLVTVRSQVRVEFTLE